MNWSSAVITYLHCNIRVTASNLHDDRSHKSRWIAVTRYADRGYICIWLALGHFCCGDTLALRMRLVLMETRSFFANWCGNVWRFFFFFFLASIYGVLRYQIVWKSGRGNQPWSFQGSPLVSTGVNSMTLRLILVLGFSRSAKTFHSCPELWVDTTVVFRTE